MNLNDKIPAAIGAVFGGGYYAGQINVGGQLYALIMSGAAGELSGRWNATTARVADAGSLNDGHANTVAMAAAGSRLAQRVQALEINGFSDWYIPSKHELEMLYRAFKPTDDENYGGYGENPSSVPPGEDYTDDLPVKNEIAALQQDEPDALIPNWYWSSTQHEANPDYAWVQNFSYGRQYDARKSYAGRARAVRRLPIQSFDNSESLSPKELFMREHLRQGETYAGLLLGRDGAPDQHVFLLPGEVEDVDWAAANAWAAAAGGRLPTRSEQSLLFANVKSEFKPKWYWSGEQLEANPDYAWYQYFYDGNQDDDHKSYAGRARAVRSLTI